MHLQYYSSIIIIRKFEELYMNKIYLSVQDVIDDIKDIYLKDELQYQYDKEKQKYEEQIDKLYNELEEKDEEIDDLYGRLGYDD